MKELEKLERYIEEYQKGNIDDITFYFEYRHQYSVGLFINHKVLENILENIRKNYQIENDDKWGSGTFECMYNIYKSRKREKNINQLLDIDIYDRI